MIQLNLTLPLRRRTHTKDGKLRAKPLANAQLFQIIKGTPAANGIPGAQTTLSTFNKWLKAAVNIKPKVRCQSYIESISHDFLGDCNLHQGVQPGDGQAALPQPPEPDLLPASLRGLPVAHPRSHHGSDREEQDQDACSACTLHLRLGRKREARTSWPTAVGHA